MWNTFEKFHSIYSTYSITFVIQFKNLENIPCESSKHGIAIYEFLKKELDSTGDIKEQPGNLSPLPPYFPRQSDPCRGGSDSGGR